MVRPAALILLCIGLGGLSLPGVATGATVGTAAAAGASQVPAATAARDPKNPASWGKVGRNEDCPCESGKKYKHCHGRYA